jgi:hypothetical protein
MLIIPVADIFSQTLNCVLGNQACTINLYQRSTRNLPPPSQTPVVGFADSGNSFSGTTVTFTFIPSVPDGGVFLLWQSALMSTGISSGAAYWEVQVGTTSYADRIGIATQAFVTSYEYGDTFGYGVFPIHGLGGDANSSSIGWDVGGAILFNNNQVNSTLYPFKTGDILGFAFNASTGQLTLSQNGIVLLVVNNIPPGTWFPAVSFGGYSSFGGPFNPVYVPASATFGMSNFRYVVPIGYESFVPDVTAIGTDGFDALYADLYVNNAPVVNGVVCQNLNRVVRDDYLGFIGDLMFQDTQGTSDPLSPGLGTRFLFCYLEANDVAGSAYDLNDQIGL